MSLVITYDGVDLTSGNYLVLEGGNPHTWGPSRTGIVPYAMLPRASRMDRPPGPLVLPLLLGVQGLVDDGTLTSRVDALSRVLGRSGRRLVIGYSDLRWVTATWTPTGEIDLHRNLAIIPGEFRAEHAYWQAPAPSVSLQTGAFSSLPVEAFETGTAWGYTLSLTPGGAAPAPVRALFAVTGANTPTRFTLRNRITAPPEAFTVGGALTSGNVISFDPNGELVFTAAMTDVRGWWPMVDASGDVADFSTNNRDLTAAGGLTYRQDGPEFGAIDANGTTGVLSSANAAFALVASISIVGWVNADVLGTLMGAFGKGAASGGYAVWKTAGDVFAAGVGSGAATQTVTGTTPIVAGRWYHVALVWDNTAKSVTLYLDGELEAQSLGGSLTVGGYSGDLLTHAARDLTATIRYWDGKVTGVAVLAVALTQAQVRRIRLFGLAGYNGTVPDTQAGIWPVLHGEHSAATNVFEWRCTHASAAPAGRLALGWRGAYPVTA